ncbi:MAG: tetratricopeptide repeat protein, partial [Cytophagales bacterium]|nr:tetratricopeptide repeat protein [Cytophagales bacterium]
MNHYLFGMLYGSKLILLNPVGASKHQDLYEALAAVKEQGLVEELFLSRTRIQQEEQLVSCGPISAELVLHYGALDEEGLEEVVSKLCSVGEAQEKKLGQGQEAKTLCYQEVAVSPCFPASLLGLVQEESGAKASYEERVAELRQSQLARLEQVPRELEEELPEQVLFTQLVVEDKGILALADSESYKQLAKRARPSELACSPIPGSGLEVGESVSQLPSTSQAVHVSTPAEPQQAARARSHAVPRAPLELTESQGPTELERDQQEAAKLKEEIAELYSRPPQATEEADSQIVHELTTRLARLLKLEGFWTLEQDGDGAKEYIERLRKDHRTRWGQTEYGAEVNKELTALLEQAYGEALKQGASEKLVNKTPEGVARLAKVLEQLAALHQERGEQTGDLTYYPEAAVFYQNVLSVCEEEMKKVESQAAEALGYPAQIAAAYSGLAKIREAMLAIAKGGKEGVVSQGGMSVAELQEEIARDKQVLQALRTDAKARVDQLEAFLNKQGSAEEVLAGEKEYIEGSRALFADIAKTVREFLARLYQESEQELGPAPCKYTVMGLGSMALEQMTPYSDLEFAILVEEVKDAAAAEEYREYLRQLTHLVHFRVINLGETTIPMSKYGMSLDHLAKRGIHFDLGGITPLGRKDKLYDLIQPVAGMLYYLKNEGNKIAHIDKPLPFILESTCYVHGEEGLHEAYAAEKRAFLEEGQTEQGVPIYQARALKRLLKGFVELDYSNLGEVKARRQQPGDLGDLKPKFELEDAGRLYDVKQIYRLPNRLLYGLAMYYGILPASSWDAVEQLASRGIIGVGTGAQEAAHHLQYAVSFATILRLKTYLHHEQQAERVTMLSGVSPEQAQQEVSEFFTLPPAALQAGGSLFKYYYTALPLHSKIEEFFKTLGLRQQLSEWSEVLGLDNDLSYQLKTLFEVEDKFSPSKEADFFQAEAFYDDSDEARGNIHRRLLRYKEAKACYEQALAITEQVYGPEHPNVAKSLNNLGLVEDPKEAIECFKRALAIYEQACGPKHPEVARSLNNLGLAWYQLGDWKQAIECFKRALAIYKKSYGPEHSNVATILNNLGGALDQLGESKQAIECFKWALAIYEQTYGPEHPEVARSLNNLGLAWYHLGESKQAIGYFERALAIYEQAYGPEHSNVATSLNNLGLGWDNLGEHQKAIGYYEGALAIYEKVCSPKHHPLVATSLNNLGGAL